MMRTIFFMCLFAACTAVALAEDSIDAKALQGTWVPVKAELGGQPMPEAVLKTISLKMNKGQYEAFVKTEPDRGTYTLDEKANPKAITVTGTNGPNQGKTFPAIYELKDGALRICYDLSGKKRPTTFQSMAGTRLYLVTYRREAAKIPK